MEVGEGMGLLDLKNRKWHIQGTCALKGDGLYEGLDWLSSTLKEMKATGYSRQAPHPSGRPGQNILIMFQLPVMSKMFT